MAAKLLKSPMVNVPNYEILEGIAEGGAGAVYKGRSLLTGQTVAIKVIKESIGDNPEMLSRFQQEFRTVTKLLHPNIVQAVDFYQDGTIACLIMDFVEGPDLLGYVRSRGALPEEEAICIIRQVGQALHYAHSHNIIHRDVKPQNILLKTTGQVKLTDFGLVKDLVGDLKLTCTMSLLGTPHFMAPEQYADARQVDVRSDVYSLAATLYFAVTAALPFRAKSAMATLAKQAKNDLIPPRKLVPALSEHVQQAILRAMSPDPAVRPASMLEFMASLRPRGPGKLDPIEEYATQVRHDAADAASSQEERRSATRYGHTMGTACAIRNSLHDQGEKADSWPTTMKNVSRKGIALLLGRRVEPGTLLVVSLPPSDARPACLVEVRVVRVQSQRFGHWEVGCVFTSQLDDQDFQSHAQLSISA
jgi:serine/threonine protein kinase